MSLQRNALGAHGVHSVDMHVFNLRRKLTAATGQRWCIKTVRGVGFELVDAGFPPAGEASLEETG